jgi:uncharacterized protein YndB with AHSA1/START domain
VAKPLPTAPASPPTKITASPTEPTIAIQRWFDAPPHLVYRCCTEPDLLRQWWGCGMIEVVEIEMDLRVGGKWRMTVRRPDGVLDHFYGEYFELLPAERVVQSFVYEPFKESPARETSTFTPADGGTRLDVLIRHLSMAARDGHLQSGMEIGMRASHEGLDRLLASVSD